MQKLTQATKCLEPKKGVLIVNLGTPRSAQPRDVFRYLNEFLTDGRVIDIPWLKRQCLVRGLIVPTRFRQSADQYRQLWTEEGSPLLIHGRQVQKLLQEALGAEFRVELAMRYQFPTIQEGLEKLKQSNLEEILILPLFPQYASATTGSVHQKVMESLKHWTVIPKLTFINSFFDHPALIDAFCARAAEYDLNSYHHFIFSFHGLPEKHVAKADFAGCCLKEGCCQSLRANNRFCYKAQCHATARAIASQLNISENRYTICFQSRLGKDPWIQPYTSDILHDCANCGHQRLLVFCPAFVCDCLETTFEVACEYQKEFQALGGKDLHLVEGLNSHPAWIEALRQLVMENMVSISQQMSEAENFSLV